jgi:VanZ family protein
MYWEWIVFAGAAAAVSAGCLMPAHWLPPLPNDKLLHFLAFGGLALLTSRIAQNGSEQFLWLIGLLLVGWMIEMLQNLVPGRQFCWRDLAANAAGISVAGLLSYLIIRV